MSLLRYIGLIDASGTPYGVKHVENKIRVSSKTYFQDIASEQVAGHTAVHSAGYNQDIDATEEDIWEVGGIIPVPVARFRLRATSHNGDVLNGYLAKDTMMTQDGGGAKEFQLPLKIPALADVKISGLSDATGNAQCVASFEGYFE